MSARCRCGAEAIVVSGPTALCVTHARALDPAELYRLERARRAEQPPTAHVEARRPRVMPLATIGRRHV